MTAFEPIRYARIKLKIMKKAQKKSPHSQKNTFNILLSIVVFVVILVGGVAILLSFPPAVPHSLSPKYSTVVQPTSASLSPTLSVPLDHGKNYSPRNNLEQLAFNTMVNYLQQYMYPHSIVSASLDDYRITSITNARIVNNELLFGVSFSTLTHGDNKYDDPAAIGNGENSSDGWIVEKSGFVGAKLINGQYVLEGIATGEPIPVTPNE